MIMIMFMKMMMMAIIMMITNGDKKLSNHNTVLNVAILRKQTKNTRFQVSLI